MKKVILVDNYDRDWIAPSLVKENLTDQEAEVLAKVLNDGESEHSENYYMVVDQSYEMGGQE